MSLEGIDPPQVNNENRALNRGDGFPRLQLIPPQGLGGGIGPIPPGLDQMEYSDLVGMDYSDGDGMDYSTVVIPADWFDTDWLCRIPITVNSGQVPSEQIDFPFGFNFLMISIRYNQANTLT